MEIKRFLASLLGLMVIIFWSCAFYYKEANSQDYVEVEIDVEPVITIEEVMEAVEEPEQEPEQEPIKVLYRVTAYCPCEICCGEWAKNRPLDENGEPIVVGSWGVELVDGYSAASPMAFGTKVELEGIGVVEIQDRTAKWVVEEHGENIIDIYMTDHDKAGEFEVQYIEGVIQ